MRARKGANLHIPLTATTPVICAHEQESLFNNTLFNIKIYWYVMECSVFYSCTSPLITNVQIWQRHTLITGSKYPATVSQLAQAPCLGSAYRNEEKEFNNKSFYFFKPSHLTDVYVRAVRRTTHVQPSTNAFKVLRGREHRSDQRLLSHSTYNTM